ncbi:bifunctional diguanylate cyclase/phosphohydrolase [Ilyobacter polytropus]|uniref:Diguanylate cyclase and metal dependent phosphohydrolase n=1 Tax=Ilyobacter polytropus (strain ATCC 51220 / DSM 2926 / LMG 16218 / CuHBu1) TaxID=572544 RepID=E3H9J3_ILYPC|nr:HD domain-containing phosphohydrolase [Ilyobacter polytropus]ADO83382.1 diguanylate cyclase and metal dependent phosphohydrolase [Ilyobacter polytropus DSM 2926]
MNPFKYVSKKIIIAELILAYFLFFIMEKTLNNDLFNASLEIGYILVGFLGLYFFINLNMSIPIIGFSIIFLSFILDFLDEFEAYFQLPGFLGNNFDDISFLVGLLIFVSGLYIMTKKKQESSEKLEYLAKYDSLTDTYSRQYLPKILEQIQSQDSYPLGLLIMDFNGLKFINDSFGHDTGDYLIKESVLLLKNCMNPASDTLIRLGGDEFLIISPKSSQKTLSDLTKYIADTCEKTSFMEIPISLSIGHALIENPKDNFEKFLRLADDRMYLDKLINRKSIGGSYIECLKKTLEEKSYETSAHVNRMISIVKIFGEFMKTSREFLDALELATSLHDIGKIAIPESIILKPSKLDEHEWQVIKRHPEIGSRIVNGLFTLPHVEQGILAHHERWDGKGYPAGLKGEKIPLIARIISIIDSFDVMIQGRSYQNYKSVEEALEEIHVCSGKQFDPTLVTVFNEIITTDYGKISDVIGIDKYDDFDLLQKLDAI